MDSEGVYEELVTDATMGKTDNCHIHPISTLYRSRIGRFSAEL
jgi:hypothetical protein